MKRFKKILRQVGLIGKYEMNLKDEKNFVNGRFIGTKWGISAPALSAYLRRTPTPDEMVRLSKTKATELLYEKYWTGRGLINLDNDSLAALIYNGLANMGTNEMRLLIKQAVIRLGYYIEYYDVFTPKGIELLNNIQQKDLFNQIYSIKKKSFKRISSKAKRVLFLKQLSGIQFKENYLKTSSSLINRLPKKVISKLYGQFNPKTSSSHESNR